MSLRPTAVIDTADIALAVPILPSAGAVDFTGGRLTATFSPITGGEPIVTVSSDNADNAIVFVPAAAGVSAYFIIDMPVDRRDAFTVARATAVFADIKWYPDPARPQRSEWLGRVHVIFEPGTDSVGVSGLGRGGSVFSAVQPYGERIVSTPLIVGPQGAPGGAFALPIIPTDAASVNYCLGLVSGMLAWIEVPAT